MAKDGEVIGREGQLDDVIGGLTSINMKPVLSISNQQANVKDCTRNIMGASSAQEIIGWNGTAKGRSLTEPSQ